jgi:drug/metabolite transporter (DMT)-like permease
LTLQPVAAVVLAAALLDERPSPAQVAGVAVVVVGILLATVRWPGGEAARAASAST